MSYMTKNCALQKITSFPKLFGTRAFYLRALCISIPVVAQLFIQTFVSLIDNFMVAGLGDIKMSGVNVTGQINFLYMVLVGALCLSGGFFMSQFKGAQDEAGQKQVFRFKLITCSTCSIVFMCIFFVAPRGLFYLMVSLNDDSKNIIDVCIRYSRTVALSLFFMCISSCISSSLRETEIVVPPLVISVCATLVNTFLNFVLIYGHFGFPRMEEVGAALATVIARGTEMLIFIIYVAKKRVSFLFFPTRLFAIDFSLFKGIVKKSLMVIYSEMAWAISETISIALYNTRGGAEVVSGMAAGFAIGNLVLLSLQGLVTTTTVIVGQELGKGDIEKAVQYKTYLLSGAVIFGLFFIIVAFFSTFLIPIVFASLSVPARLYAKNLIFVLAIYLPLWAYINVQYATLRAGGDAMNGVISDTIANVIFVVSMLCLTFFSPLGPVALYGITKASDFAKLIVAQLGIKKGLWKKNLAKQKS